MADLLFNVRNSFYLGAYNTVINEAADLDNLNEVDSIERDCFVYRSYIALGSYDVSGFNAKRCQRSLLSSWSDKLRPCCPHSSSFLRFGTPRRRASLR